MAGTAPDRCTRAREWASLRADGELSELERLLLRRHLGRCEACHSFATSLSAATTALREAPAAEPSRSLAPHPAAARTPQPLRRPRRLAVAVAFVAVVAATGGVLGGVLSRGNDAPAPAPAPSDIALRPDTEPRSPDRTPVRPIEPPGEPV